MLLGAMLLAGAAVPASGQETRTDPMLSAEAAPLALRDALAAQSKLAFGLIRRLDQGDSRTENIMVSPASLAAVLALLDLGASDKMRTALHRTLGFDRRSARNADLDGLRATVTGVINAQGGPLTLANAIVFDPAATPYRLAVMGLRATGAEVRVEDLSKPDTLRRINEWVATHTKGLIPTILDDAPRDGGLVALNALYFKDRWRTPFDPRATAPAPFHTLDGRSIEVPMMHHATGKFRFRQDERFVAVDLDYATDGFGITIVTTKDKPARAREFAGVVGAGVMGWLGGDGFTSSNGELALPRFSLTGKVELIAALDALGLRRARQSPAAFRGLSPVPQVITRVVQKTELRVDEAGTEAAAATAVTTTRALQVDYVKMVVDKPFVFALRDGGTGLILLAGYVGRPAAGRATADAAR
jgi:serpin B